jgi:diacylglycerol kinase (ATP)
MTGAKVVIFANPIAGRGRGRALTETLAERLREVGFDVVVRFEQAKGEADGNLHAAVAVGGDGTLRDVVRWANGRAPVLLVPMGTANLMGQYLKLNSSGPRAMDQMVDALLHPRVIHLDVATANDGLMLLVAGIGIDGKIVHELQRVRRGPISKLSYLLPALRTLAKWDYPPITVHLDGRCVMESQPAMAFVGNVREYGAGFPLLPHARPDDGVLDLCVLPCRNFGQLVSLFMHAAGGSHTRLEGVFYGKGQHVRVESPRPVAVEVDGEAAGFTPLDIRLLPTRIPFLAPGWIAGS